MVYEADRQRTLLFGGFLENNQYCNETWEFDGQAWRRLDIASPPADSGYALAYDIYRGVAILHGGRNRETWEFDAMKWNQVRCEHRPPMIGGGAMAYDPNRRVTVLFGGEMLPTRDSLLPVLINETWQYDGYDWTNLDLRGPSPRKYHQMAYDSARERFVVFGGFDGKPLNDTWELRSADWRPIETRESPSPRRGFALTYDPIHRQVLLFGGFPGGDELWAFDGTQWSRIMAVHSPPYREGAGLVFIPTTCRVLLFSGLSTRLLNDSWEFVWPTTQAALPLPPPPAHEPTEVETAASARPWRPPREQIIPPVLEPPSLGPENDLLEITTPSALTERPKPAPTPPALAERPIPKATTESSQAPSKSATKRPVPADLLDLADLHFEDMAIPSSTLTPKRAFSLSGSLVNSGKKDASCWVEIWLSFQRDQYVRAHLLCPSVHVQVKAGQSVDLSRWRPVPYTGVPPGRYHIAFEVDRFNEVAEQNEDNNVSILSPVYTIPPAE